MGHRTEDMPQDIGHATGHRTAPGPGPTIALAGTMAQAILGPGPGAHGLMYGPWACPMSYDMFYVLWHVFCPVSHVAVLCPMVLCNGVGS